jgi:hypothetical protein
MKLVTYPHFRYCLSENKELINSLSIGSKMTRHAGAMKMDTTGYEKFTSIMAAILIKQYNDITRNT